MMKWRKAAERGEAWSPVYELVGADEVLATVVRTGRSGVDDYPWDWSVELKNPRPKVKIRLTGVTSTKREACEMAVRAVHALTS